MTNRSMALVGVASGLVTAILIGGAAGFALAERARANVRNAWELAFVAVAAQDLEAGELVGLGVLARRAVPAQFATASAIKPEEVSRVVDLPVRVPMRAGEVLLWSNFDASDDDAACMALVRETAASAAPEDGGSSSPALVRLVGELARISSSARR